MSRLLGPLSETIKSVSERASALAADQIAGAGTMAPAATPVTDLRKSRRFIRGLQRTRKGALEKRSQGLCQNLMKTQPRFNGMIRHANIAHPASTRAEANCIQRRAAA